MTYVFKVLKDCEFGKVGEIIEVTLKITEYDAFKQMYSTERGELERYIDTVPAMAGIFGAKQAVLPNAFKDKLKRIRDNYPGAKGMLNDSKYNYVGEH